MLSRVLVEGTTDSYLSGETSALHIAKIVTINRPFQIIVMNTTVSLQNRTVVKYTFVHCIYPLLSLPVITSHIRLVCDYMMGSKMGTDVW